MYIHLSMYDVLCIWVCCVFKSIGVVITFHHVTGSKWSVLSRGVAFLLYWDSEAACKTLSGVVGLDRGMHWNTAFGRTPNQWHKWIENLPKTFWIPQFFWFWTFALAHGFSSRHIYIYIFYKIAKAKIVMVICWFDRGFKICSEGILGMGLSHPNIQEHHIYKAGNWSWFQRLLNGWRH